MKILRENAPKEKVDGWATVLMFLRQNLAFEEIAAQLTGLSPKKQKTRN